ncbi:MAG: flagellar basal-body rod protein FlgG [Candidatus Sericytochromatia bacterium]|nr:flagellar basal-body rod protein FlgG [Candidatus Sericytochromatia bacterium]
MMGALWTAATGMRAQQTNIDVTSNNLANANTLGYKKVRAEFKDLMYRTAKQAGTPMQSGTQMPVGTQIGMGVNNSATARIFSQGDFQQTENPFDLVIEGEGFFQVQRPDGTVAFTRDGSFKTDGNGQLVTSEGLMLVPQITLPPNAANPAVTPEGTITVQIGNNVTTVGQLTLARFINPAGLTAIGHNLYMPTPASGDPVVGSPNVDGMGTLAQGYIEMSNVKVVEEMINLIIAQRAYEANSKSVQTSDEMLGMANNLRR